MTKKVILSAALLLFSVGAFAQAGKLRLKGVITDAGDTLHIKVGEQIDKFVLKKGKFDTTISVAKAAQGVVYTPDSRKYFQLLVVPNETVELKGSIDQPLKMAGSAFYKQYNEAKTAADAAAAPIRQLTDSLSKALKAGAKQADIEAVYDAKVPELLKGYNVKVLDFIRQHPTWDASAALITRVEGLEEMEQAVNLLSENVKNGKLKPFYEKRIQQLKAQREAIEKAKVVQAAGAQAPEFTLNDLNGNPLALSSLRGKYVLLDFWGSWCGWCIKGFPKLKEYYQKYNGKFEILGIDCNDSPEAWKSAVERYKLPWLHVYNPKDSKVLTDYAIQGFPTKILIDPNGNVVKTVVGEDPAFYTFMDETFGQ